MRRLLLLTATMLALPACTPVPVEQAAMPEPAGPVLASADAAQCRAGGGLIERRGRLRAEACVQPFADAGRVCSDNDQCAGDCITDIAEQENGSANVTGMCQADDRPFGCFAKVVNGRATGGICID